jgi:PKD repeat protein
MKGTMLFIAGMAIACVSYAQSQISNADFEQWSVMSNGKDSAVQWSSSNSVVIGMNNSLVKSMPGHAGTAAAHVITAPFGFVQYSTLGMLVNGNATFSYGGGGGGANVAYESGGGTPINFKPDTLKGFYKYETLTTTDQGLAVVLLSHYNTTTNKRDTVSLTTYSFTTVNAYTPFKIALPDQMPGTTPDTITTIFYSSNPATIETYSAWSDLYLDDISLTGATLLPDADFTADVLSGNTNTLVSFTDNSSNTPTAWQWTITPSTVAYQSGTTATSENPKVKFSAAGDYTVKLRVSNTAGADSLTKTNYIHITSSGTGIEDPEFNLKSAIYPNPAWNKLHLTMQYRGCDISIMNIVGKTLLKYKNVTTGSVDIAMLPEGIYLVNIAKGSKTATGKLVVQKR